ncbi:MAG: glycoside hydrolase family 104 protein [Xanthomonadales bacterium]|nr:glycoside hydrolase family 104 protein [Xanthomonadales bacterium]
MQAFLALLRHTEGAGYHTLFGGEQFESLADHPRHKVTRMLGGRPITSSAAGAYQFLTTTWDECAKALHLEDFSERSQDLAALFLIDRRKALDFVIVGQWENAITACNREWASLPGSPYGQPTHSMSKCLAFLAKQPGSSSAPLTGGQAVPAAAPAVPHPAPAVDTPIDTPPLPPRIQASAPASAAAPAGEQKTEPKKGFFSMPPFIMAALPWLMQAAPSLIRIFGNGEQSEKNAKTAETVAALARTVTGAETTEGAVMRIQEDQQMARNFAAAVEEKWYTLVGEAGGGGIAGARQADVEARERPLLSPAMLVTMMLLPLAYLVVGAVLFMGGWSDEIRAMVVSSVLSLIVAGATGFWLGTSFGSQKKTDMLVDRR